MDLMQNRQPIFGDKSTVLENTDGCANQYRCDIAL